MSEYINFIPTIYVRGDKVALEAINDDVKINLYVPVEIANLYSNNGADEILAIDCSKTDEEHEKSIATFKEIVRKVDIPLALSGNIKRLEDIKKYTYTGAKHVIISKESEQEMALYDEAVKRFGKDKIVVDTIETIKNFDVKDFFFGNMEKLEGGNRNLYLTISPDTDFFGIKQILKGMGINVKTFKSEIPWSEFKLNSDNLVPVVVQDYRTLEVLMVAYMNEEAYKKTIKTGRMTYFSRSRNKLWVKGETSGHYQYVKSLILDCDNDTILAKVAQVGVACHTGSYSCFFKPLIEKEYTNDNPHKVFENVYDIIIDRKKNPKEGSYTNYLFDKGIDKILKKVGEEATEIVIAAKNPDPEEIKYEISDFLYHIMVLMAEKGVTWEDITRELANR